MRLSDSVSNYNSMQLYATKRKGALALTAGYTWSKALADSSGNGDNLEDAVENRHFSYGPTSFDRRHVFFATYIYKIPFFGNLSDRFARRPVYLAGAIGAAVWVFVFFILLDTGQFWLIVLAAVIALVLHAAMYGPQAAFISEMFPTKVRYTGASMGYQLAGIFGGALAPIISVALLDRFDTSVAVSLYAVAMLLITIVCVLLAPETSKIDLHSDPVDQRMDSR